MIRRIKGKKAASLTSLAGNPANNEAYSEFQAISLSGSETFPDKDKS